MTVEQSTQLIRGHLQDILFPYSWELLGVEAEVVPGIRKRGFWAQGVLGGEAVRNVPAAMCRCQSPGQGAVDLAGQGADFLRSAPASSRPRGSSRGGQGFGGPGSGKVEVWACDLPGAGLGKEKPFTLDCSRYRRSIHAQWISSLPRECCCFSSAISRSHFFQCPTGIDKPTKM